MLAEELPWVKLPPAYLRLPLGMATKSVLAFYWRLFYKALEAPLSEGAGGVWPVWQLPYQYLGINAVSTTWLVILY